MNHLLFANDRDEFFLHKQGYPAGFGLVGNVGYPLGICLDFSLAPPGFGTDDHPVDALEVEVGYVAEEGFEGDVVVTGPDVPAQVGDASLLGLAGDGDSSSPNTPNG